MPPNAEQVQDDSVSGEESLRLAGRLEAAHLSLSLAGRLMGDFGTVVRVLPRIVPDGGHGGSMRCPIAPQLVGHEQHRLCPLAFQEFTEEALCGASIATRLDKDVDHIAVLIDGSPEILPLALDRDEELVQVPCVSQTASRKEAGEILADLFCQWRGQLSDQPGRSRATQPNPLPLFLDRPDLERLEAVLP